MLHELAKFWHPQGNSDTGTTPNPGIQRQQHTYPSVHCSNIAQCLLPFLHKCSKQLFPGPWGKLSTGAPKLQVQQLGVAMFPASPAWRSANRARGALLEMRAASWSLLAMTNTNTGGTFAIILIFSSLTDVSFPRKHSKLFLSTREHTDSIEFGHLRQGDIRPSASFGEKSGFHQCLRGFDTQIPRELFP